MQVCSPGTTACLGTALWASIIRSVSLDLPVLVQLLTFNQHQMPSAMKDLGYHTHIVGTRDGCAYLHTQTNRAQARITFFRQTTRTVTPPPYCMTAYQVRLYRCT